MTYPKMIEIELRLVLQKPGSGLRIQAHWFEVFWSPEHSRIEVATGKDGGDYIYEDIVSVDNDCFLFRGRVYDFMSVTPIKTDEIVDVVRSLSEMVEDTTDLDNIYLDSEGKSFPKSKVVSVLSTLGYETE